MARKPATQAAPAKKTRAPKTEAAAVEAAPAATPTRRPRKANPALVKAKLAFQQAMVDTAQEEIDTIDTKVGELEDTIRADLLAKVEEKVQSKMATAGTLLAKQRDAAEKRLASAQIKLEALPTLEEA